MSDSALLKQIQQWMAMETPSNEPTAVAALAHLVHAQAKAAGLQAKIQTLGSQVGPLLSVSNRLHGDTRAGILVLAHLDTVHPVGSLARNPVRVEGDRCFGPGGLDMKAGACVAFKALECVTRRNAHQLPIEMLWVPDEEIGSAASRPVIENAARRARYALVGEPAREGGRCVTARKGIGALRVQAHGCAAHAGLHYRKGRSAIRELAHQVLALEAMADWEQGVTVNVGQISGGTSTNTVPEFASLAPEFRVPSPALAESLCSRVLGLHPCTPGVRLSIDAWIKRPPYERSAESAALLLKAQACAASAGFALQESPMAGGASDANFTAAMGVPTLDTPGVGGDGAHTAHEYFLVSTLALRLAFWTALLESLS